MFQLIFEYTNMNKVMRTIKNNKLEIISQKMEMNCEFLIPIRIKNSQNIKEQFQNLRCVKIKEVVN